MRFKILIGEYKGGCVMGCYTMYFFRT